MGAKYIMICYRKATIDDLEQLVRLRLEFLREIQGGKSAEQEAEVRQAFESYLRTAMARKEFIAWVACDGEQIVGTSGLCFCMLPPSHKNVTGRAADILNMYTQSNYRNRGIATNLFKKITDEAVSLGYKNLFLHATEKGKPLYLKFGFKCTDNEMVLNVE